MEKIANRKDIKLGGSLPFTHKGEQAILVRTKEDDLVAYIAICPHAGGNIEWDEQINKLLCETHLSLFDGKDGSVYRHSSAFEVRNGLTRIELKVDEDHNIYAL
ncbi:MAG: Rieske 2Fe-2S domain-containing protein [Deltaproteobacteria bacterium]|nr:MAG: Rieske 2Fe-2S domain-containing protein [Deltaproteobacteria bacterium]